MLSVVRVVLLVELVVLEVVLVLVLDVLDSDVLDEDDEEEDDSEVLDDVDEIEVLDVEEVVDVVVEDVEDMLELVVLDTVVLHCVEGKGKEKTAKRSGKDGWLVAADSDSGSGSVILDGNEYNEDPFQFPSINPTLSTFRRCNKVRKQESGRWMDQQNRAEQRRRAVSSVQTRATV
uniref:Uncharacterized protein n=1 Tax=Psilocybe cubensis TaxID=181762 RepID=A0A8H7Y1P9_PSICU